MSRFSKIAAFWIPPRVGIAPLKAPTNNRKTEPAEQNRRTSLYKPTMTAQSNPPGMPSGPAGLMNEQTFNEALAAALRQRRLELWREDERYVIAERQQVLVDASRERPDILVAPPDIYPIVIEVEWDEPAFGDARRKLGVATVVGTTLTGTLYHRRGRAAGNSRLVKRLSAGAFGGTGWRGAAPGGIVRQR